MANSQATTTFTFHLIAVLCFLMVHGEPAALSGSIEHSLYTGLQLGKEASLQFTPASNYLNKLGLTLRISDIYKVHNVLKSLTSIIQYQQRLNSSEIASSQEVAVTNMVLQEIIEDACDWINSTVVTEPFLCTEEDAKSLMASIELYQSMIDAALMFTRVCRVRAGHCTSTPYIQWVMENIPCEGEGIAVREYIANPSTEFPGVYDDLSAVKCTVDSPTIDPPTDTPGPML